MNSHEKNIEACQEYIYYLEIQERRKRYKEYLAMIEAQRRLTEPTFIERQIDTISLGYRYMVNTLLTSYNFYTNHSA